MNYNTHDLGDLVEVSVAFTEEDSGDPLDPTAVKLSVKTPAGVVSTLTYGVDGAVVKDATGEYHANINANESGTWYYRWWSTGTGQAAEEKRFVIRPARAV